MMTLKIRLYLSLAGLVLLAGCAGESTRLALTRVSLTDGKATAAVMEAAEDVLARMHFPIEKMDVEQGIIRTRPLRGGQFFEFWRSDNAGWANVAEANLQTIRRAVELRVATDGGTRRLVCDVWVQRLSLPENEVASISQGYRIHSKSNPNLQTLELTPEQEQALVWIDLGKDPRLAAEIIRRLEKTLDQAEEEEAK